MMHLLIKTFIGGEHFAENFIGDDDDELFNKKFVD